MIGRDVYAGYCSVRRHLLVRYQRNGLLALEPVRTEKDVVQTAGEQFGVVCVLGSAVGADKLESGFETEILDEFTLAW